MQELLGKVVQRAVVQQYGVYRRQVKRSQAVEHGHRNLIGMKAARPMLRRGAPPTERRGQFTREALNGVRRIDSRLSDNANLSLVAAGDAAQYRLGAPVAIRTADIEVGYSRVQGRLEQTFGFARTAICKQMRAAEPERSHLVSRKRHEDISLCG